MARKKRRVQSQKQEQAAKQEALITFRRTGHFWNDLGIMALWRWLAEDASEVQKKSDDHYIAIHEDAEFG